ncbi:MAG: hypothetical protein JSS60_01510 [Verrucomicrobia bacterium]|nr:hypothetical protein [Verrucomicrobiota bacterium]
MNTIPAFLITALLFLSACTSSGYNRSYIISDSLDEEVLSESVEKR